MIAKALLILLYVHSVVKWMEQSLNGAVATTWFSNWLLRHAPHIVTSLCIVLCFQHCITGGIDIFRQVGIYHFNNQVTFILKNWLKVHWICLLPNIEKCDVKNHYDSKDLLNKAYLLDFRCKALTFLLLAVRNRTINMIKKEALQIAMTPQPSPEADEEVYRL